ncbi:hypothetical protein ISN40_21990 [Enterobacter asburiae]|uniref:hypothetical protein n=1 Tax=Enterobacter asburiae TaxID=61645 RepID=UPI0018872056|nr:hypothetical protein [Enterobacter asburiae]MBF2792865.1 hypothetical protein [Enterobacter asburiae]
MVISAIAGAFGLGHIRGTSKAKSKADQQRTEDNAAATVAAAERRVTLRGFFTIWLFLTGSASGTV